jgi:flagellar export protein FliJ
VKPFPLEKVLDVRRHTRQQRRHALAEAMADEQTLLELKLQREIQRQQLLDQLTGLSQAESLNVEAAARRRYFSGQIDIQIMVLDQQIEEARQHVERARSALIVADQDVKALEKLRETHFAEQAHAENRRNEIVLAEQWQSANWNW